MRPSLLALCQGEKEWREKTYLLLTSRFSKHRDRRWISMPKKSVKILVVGNPANTNALMCSHYAPSIPKKNFSAMTRLDHNRASAQLANKVGAKVQDIKKVIIWGNHSSTQFPDASHATVNNQSVAGKVDDAWIQNEFVPTVQKRGAAVIAD